MFWTGAQAAMLALQLCFDHFDFCFDQSFRNQRGKIRHNFLDFRTTAGKTRYSRRTCQNQRREFFGKSFNVFTALTAHAETELDFGNVFRRRARKMPVRRAPADKFRQDDIEFQT